jgi:hypothetical protein
LLSLGSGGLGPFRWWCSRAPCDARIHHSPLLPVCFVYMVAVRHGAHC